MIINREHPALLHLFKDINSEKSESKLYFKCYQNVEVKGQKQYFATLILHKWFALMATNISVPPH